MTRIVPGEVVHLESPDEIYAGLRGKTVESVEWQHYRPIFIRFTDGTVLKLETSGQPPTIFPVVVQ